ncbi:hypothetical protein HZC35_03180 [Candidatus Saganbacteria bacterium]|nr:hypothetical protein [Candidatus Saganbacteria bacterium]
MGIAEIKKKILDEAEEKAARLRAETEKEIGRNLAEAKLQAEELRRKILAEGARQAEEEKRTLLTPVHLLAKQQLLEEKHRLLNLVFAGMSAEIREKKEIEVARFLYG